MSCDFAVLSAAKERRLAPLAALGGDPPSPAVKRLPGVAGSPRQDASTPGLIVFWRLIGGNGTWYRGNDRGEGLVRSPGFEHDAIQRDPNPLLAAARRKNFQRQTDCLPIGGVAIIF
jgi:hypothetical protein